MKMVRYSTLGWFIPFSMAVALLLYIFSAMKVVHHHESAFTLLYGQNLLEHYGFYSGTFMGREAAYITWALVAAAMVKLFGVTLFAHAMTSALFLVFVAGVVIFFCRLARLSTVPCVFLASLVFINFNFSHQPYRWFDQVWLWPMNSYGIYDFLSMLYLLLAYLLLVGKNANKTNSSNNDFVGMIPWRRAVSFLIVTMLLSLNSIRGLMTIVLPVLIALAVEFVYRQNFDVSRLRRAMWMLIPAVVGIVLGMLLHKTGTQDSFQPTQQAHTAFGTPNISIRIWLFWERWYELFDALPQSGFPIFSLAGLGIVTKFLFASILFFSPIFNAKKLARCGVFHRLVLYKHFTILFIVYFAYLYGTSHQERYLIPVAISSFFVFVLLINSWIIKREWNKVVFVSLFLIIPFYSSLNFYVENSVKYLKNPDLALSQNPNYRLTKFLLQHGLSHGFSSNWATSQLTIKMYSQGRIDIGLIDDDTFTPHWHGDMAWYRPRNIASSFLVVNDVDFQTQFWPQYLVTKYQPKALRFEDKSIYIFDFDINSILNDLKQVLNCSPLVAQSSLTSEVDLLSSIRGKGGLGCTGWGGYRKTNDSFGRELLGHASVYLAATGPSIIHVTGGSWRSGCGRMRCGNEIGKGVVIYRGKTKVAEHYFEEGLKDFSFRDNLLPGEQMVQYVFMPQGEGIIVNKLSLKPEVK
jgi:hypothetical protein